MKVTAEDFRRQYASLSDEELLALQRDDLVEVARKCYDEELAHRRLTPAPAQAVALEMEAEEVEFPSAEPDEANQPMEVGIFVTPGAANQARAVLRGSGIPCYLENEHGWMNMGGVRLMVPATYFDQAHELLEEGIADGGAPTEHEPWDGETEHR